jgi:hypothetical protein
MHNEPAQHLSRTRRRVHNLGRLMFFDPVQPRLFTFRTRQLWPPHGCYNRRSRRRDGGQRRLSKGGRGPWLNPPLVWLTYTCTQPAEFWGSLVDGPTGCA